MEEDDEEEVRGQVSKKKKTGGREKKKAGKHLHTMQQQQQPIRFGCWGKTRKRKTRRRRSGVNSQVSKNINNRGKRKEEGGERHLLPMHQQQPQQRFGFACLGKEEEVEEDEVRGE